ncbi:MAG TPA: prolipoprotein diacylglyceryl transferase [Candidatus Nanoarchaeia archaeon]|nr:prolipoprotein diacylglyceryl transferase [Candidatus Nanoarchaeia archaeon]
MFIHTIDPVVFSLGPLEIRYYGIIYAFGFILAYFLLRYFIRQKKLHMQEQELDTYIIYLMLGVVLGARLFEILFYNLPFYLEHPAELIAIWHGGLSFHGGLVGAVFSTWLFCKKKKIPLLHLCDYVVIPTALALALGRIGNFLNGELPGKITNVPWAVQFPGAEGFRHPSQLYESVKNLIIFAILLVNVKKQHKDGYLFGLFLFWYGILRFLVEYVREPETMVWFLTMGQALSVPLIIVGLYFIKKKRLCRKVP